MLLSSGLFFRSCYVKVKLRHQNLTKTLIQILINNTGVDVLAAVNKRMLWVFQSNIQMV